MPRGGTPQGNTTPVRIDDRSIAPDGVTDQDSRVTRDVTIERAARWSDNPVAYSMEKYFDGYRADCSGYVSMAWNLSESRTTWTLVDVCGRQPIGKNDLRPGDVLIKNDVNDPQYGSHVVIFAGWADAERTAYRGYEQTPPQTRYNEAVP